MHKIPSYHMCINYGGEKKQIPYLVKVRPTEESSACLGAWSRKISVLWSGFGLIHTYYPLTVGSMWG